MSFDVLLKVAKRVDELGEVARMSTSSHDPLTVPDTMEEESTYFLDLTVKTDKPHGSRSALCVPRPPSARSSLLDLSQCRRRSPADCKAKVEIVLIIMNDTDSPGRTS